MDLTGAIRCQDDEWRRGRPQRSKLWNRDLELGQQFQKESLEFFVGAIDFINEQDGRPGAPRIDGLEQRPLNQERFAVEFAVRARAIERVRGIENPQLQQLPRIIPLVKRMADVQPFIALKTNQIGAERRGRSGSERRLTDAGFTFEKERPIETKRQKQRDRKAAIGYIVLLG